MQQPTSRALKLEAAVLADAGLAAESFDIGGGLGQKGDRRPYRFALQQYTCNYEGGGLKLAFSLPKGCYATIVLKEITKQQTEELPGDDD